MQITKSLCATELNGLQHNLSDMPTQVQKKLICSITHKKNERGQKLIHHHFECELLD